jgi:hypothetical protein
METLTRLASASGGTAPERDGRLTSKDPEPEVGERGEPPK